MRYLLVVFLTVLLSCQEEQSPFPIKEHEVLKKEIADNYQANRQLIQSVAAEVSKFKVLRAVNFDYDKSSGKGIHIYCDTISRSTKGESFTIEDLNHPQLASVLMQEGITVKDFKALKEKLEQFKCNSFFSFEQLDSNTGETYIHTEFRFNSWNGINFYYYKIFDKKLDSSMTSFFTTHLANVNEGAWKNKGGIIDSNAIWYYVNH